jgi:hypothetical protein
MKSKHKRLKRKIARKNRVIYCLTEQLDVMRERMDDAEKFHSLVSEPAEIAARRALREALGYPPEEEVAAPIDINELAEAVRLVLPPLRELTEVVRSTFGPMMTLTELKSKISKLKQTGITH